MTRICILGSGLAMIVVSSGLVVFFCPAGALYGLPEVIGFLNGASIQHIFNIKTFLGTFVSCVLAVASGLFCGLEGHMIHLGAIIGCGLTQFKSDTLGIQLPFFTRFWNSADKQGQSRENPSFAKRKGHCELSVAQRIIIQYSSYDM
ncbi:chloride channel protein B-like [Dermochelys coriacea]|uniref:chloride channel protein B-like n=1 Tax=Dermochelys coriacea TaxID=27794 RepID=UPI001CA91BFA|nr:chloride channel protein B-like [Dermochelys coriacea]